MKGQKPRTPEGVEAENPAVDSAIWKTEEGYPKIPGYEIIGELGRGGMGVVYKARQHQLKREVAVKVIRNTGHESQELQRRFRRETQAAARLSHPNIITVYDAGVIGDTYYLVMQYLEGIDLERLVLDSGPLPVARACDYIRQAALGLQHASEQGLVHRDIKPANLMVVGHPESDHEGDAESTGLVKILDMGLARLHWSEGESSFSHMTTEGTIMGTPDYMAPEQVENSHGVDIRADLYSLGCTFYYLLTGWVPFPAHSPLEKLDKHRWARPTPVERIRHDVPRAVSAIIRKLMAKRPEERYQTPAQLVEALDALASQTPTPPVDQGVQVPGQALDAEFERLQFTLADLLERNAVAEARDLLDTMFRLKPNDSLALSVRAFLDEQVAVGECRRFEGHADWVWSAAFTPDGQRFLSGSGDRMLFMWDVSSGRKLSFFAGHTDAIKCLVFSADGSRALSGGRDQTVRLWDLTQGQPLRIFQGHASTVESVAFAPNGRQIASCGGRSIRLWDVDTGQRLCRLSPHEADVKSLVFSSDGRFLLSGSWDHTVRLWDVLAGCERRRFDGAMNLFTSVALSPDGKYALGGGSDNSVYLWDVDTGRELHRFQGHTHWVTSVVFSPDGKRALSGSQDNSLRLWNVETGRELHKFEGHTNWVNCVAFSPDGRYALSGSADCTLRLWRLPR